ncbi:hypothetical protein N752_29535 [Desulforamulus aquiferis]|nr:N-6 DNA methylase [Desulforamulus aquiferis]RYD01720.1 hypothetical protein N752_29535 [Desulforamulus aquiferis]
MNSSVVEKYSKQKMTGSHFTPAELAKAVARRLLSNMGKSHSDTIFVMDPSCGDGELLLNFALESKGYKLNLLGIEEDLQSIEIAKARLDCLDINAEFNCIDFFSLVSKQANFDYKPDKYLVDVIIANPPYVRTQILGADYSQRLAKEYNLSGRVDLYHAFLVAMTSQLKIGGLLGVITSNRYLTTKGGSSVRKFLAEHYEIIEIIDLGDTKLFEAAVLPAVFFGRKKANKSIGQKEPANFLRIYETDKEVIEKTISVSSIYDIIGSSRNGVYSINNKNTQYQMENY